MANIVISESIPDFLDRQRNNFNEILIGWGTEISKNDYNNLKDKNPTNESYFRLKDEDYSEYVEEEDDEEDCGEFDEDSFQLK